MKEHPTAKATCPLAAVDQRLADAHMLWHQAEAAYFDPNGFRLAVQNTIQTLRTVTFILQKNKAIIPNFDQWYGNWQERLRTEPLMCWMVTARNRIEKQGDLESYSIIRAEILASYLDEGPSIDVPAHLFDDAKTLLRGIPDNSLGQHIVRNGVLRIQRRWVENTLPDYELLDAVAIAYGKITELVHDAHQQIGLDPPQTIHDDAGVSYDLPAMDWRFPCMIGHEIPRSLTISLADGSKVEFEAKSVPVKADAAKVAALLARYSGNPFEAMGRDYKTDAELAAGYFAMIRALFLRDGHHESMLFLLRNRRPIKMIGINVDNVQQKYLVMRQLADEVTKSGAETAILIGEAWKALANQLKPYERPADSSARTEELFLTMVSKCGDPFHLFADIVRDGKHVSLSDTMFAEGVAPFYFAPFYKAWGRNVPQAWIDTSSDLMAKARHD